MYSKEFLNNFTQLIKSKIDDELQDISKRKKIIPPTASYISDLLYILNNIDSFEVATSDTQPKELNALDTMEDELEASQKYLDAFRETQDTDYFRMAKEELAHAKKFLLEIKNQTPNNPRLQAGLSHYNQLEAEIKKATG